jgi:HEPN domain-containing protein
MEISKEELQALSETRLLDAVLLLENSRAAAAYYLAGYAIELSIKACIAKRIRGGVLPDRNFITRVYQRKLADLIVVAN